MPNIVINTDWFNRLLAADNPAEIGIQLFLSGGWVIFAFVILWGIWHLWIEARQDQYASTIKKVLLSVDVPKDTEQSPKAVEFIFATIAGALSALDRIEKYWIGKGQPTFSFEIVSMGGYVQFYIHTWTKFRDLVEAAVYAQYPDAEITEVEDYVHNIPKRFPEPGWKLFGMEFKLFGNQYHPIRRYVEFEDKLSGELKDPMASLLEGLSKLRSGEQLWLQILVRPMISDAWVKKGLEFLKELIGRTDIKQKITFGGELAGLPSSMIDAAMMADAQVKEKKEDPISMSLHLSPGEKALAEAVQEKISKESFKTKIRFIYASKEEVFAKARTVSLMKGFFGQFTVLGQNGLRPYPNTTTRTDYVWQREKIFEYLTLFMTRTVTTRQNVALTAYRGRDMDTGAPASILNIEELASLYHFPVIGVKAPLIKKTESKRAEPPVGLPISTPMAYPEIPSPAISPPARAKAAAPIHVPLASPSFDYSSTPPARESGPPENLPFVE